MSVLVSHKRFGAVLYKTLCKQENLCGFGVIFIMQHCSTVGNGVSVSKSGFLLMEIINVLPESMSNMLELWTESMVCSMSESMLSLFTKILCSIAVSST